MRADYPTTFEQTRDWAKANNVSIAEARRRFVQFAILCAIAESPPLRESIVLKGGNALDFVWSSNRSTLDLDFSFDASLATFALNSETLESHLQIGLDAISEPFGILFSVHRIRQQPPGADRTFFTLEARIGYALADEPSLRRRILAGDSSPNVVPLEVSVNEPICGVDLHQFDPAFAPLRVSTIEDIVAEKLRALLQQPVRNRTRRQDLLDIAVMLERNSTLDCAKVARFMMAKAVSRNVPISKVAFHDPEIAMRARQGYDELSGTTRRVFIPFDEALALLLGFVDQLDIPEG